MGHGKGYELFHGENRHETARQVLEGRLEWKHPVDEVNKYIENLQQAYKADILQEETKRINAVILAAEFRFYFKRRKRLLNPLPLAGTLVTTRPYWEVTS